jgi:hypothetical protein
MNPILAPLTVEVNRVVAALHKGAWDYVATVAIVIILLVLIRHTHEILPLRVAAQRQNEVSVM